jgi:hypothetical protein
MSVFVTTLVLFVGALAFHLVLWRVRLPKYHTRTLLLLFASVLAVWLPLTLLIGTLAWPELLHICMYYTSLALCYVITYSALEADSPTLSLIRHLHATGSRGLSEDEVRSFLETRPFVRARLNALVHDGLVAERDGRFFVASNGSPFFRVILGFRSLYGAIEQGG